MAEDTTTTAAPAAAADTTTSTTQQATTTATQTTDTTSQSSATTGAPQAYVWTGADGKQLFEPDAIAHIEPIARDLGMTQEQATKFGTILARYGDEEAKSNAQALADRKAQWQKEIREDSKLGGQNYESTVRNVDALLDRLAVSDSDKAFFKATGIGMHPAMVRLLSSVHERSKEDSFSTKTPTDDGVRLSDAEVFYGKK